MKALDTPVLLALLEGSGTAREQLRRLRGVEVATTEANMIELIYLAVRGPRRARNERLSALSRLRRRLTVLPIDSKATEEVGRRLTSDGTETYSPLVISMLGALEANGCDELLTDGKLELQGKWRLKVRSIG